jgi:DNA sulfur modification protein DndE
MSIESFKLSENAKQQLITLKRRTGIEHWNVLCRWAFCLSLAEKSIPPNEDIPSDSSVEITWKTFGGKNSDIYLALLRQRAHNDNYMLSDDNEVYYLRLHIHRGISYLLNKTNSGGIVELLKIV